MRYIKIDGYIIKTPILDILNKLRLSLTNGKLRTIEVKNKDILVPCPVHSDGLEDKPACNIYIGDDERIPYGYARCFVCSFKGSFLKFVAKCFDQSIDYAVNWLISNFEYEKSNDLQIKLDDYIASPTFSQSVIINNRKAVDNKFSLDGLQDWHPYLEKRRLSRDICEKFNVKYDAKYRQIVFPVYDKNNQIIMMPKRSIDTKSFYLDSGVEKPLYNMHEILQKNIKKCMIVEGPIDNLSCWSHGVPAISTFGAPSDEQVEQINKSCISVLYLAFDNDKAGRKFSYFVKDKLDKRILTINVHLPINKKDVNDLSDEEWEKLIINYNLPKISNL